jgi:hypothetical protein
LNGIDVLSKEPSVKQDLLESDFSVNLTDNQSRDVLAFSAEIEDEFERYVWGGF